MRRSETPYIEGYGKYVEQRDFAPSVGEYIIPALLQNTDYYIKYRNNLTARLQEQEVNQKKEINLNALPAFFSTTSQIEETKKEPPFHVPIRCLEEEDFEINKKILRGKKMGIGVIEHTQSEEPGCFTFVSNDIHFYLTKKLKKRKEEIEEKKEGIEKIITEIPAALKRRAEEYLQNEGNLPPANEGDNSLLLILELLKLSNKLNEISNELNKIRLIFYSTINTHLDLAGIDGVFELEVIEGDKMEVLERVLIDATNNPHKIEYAKPPSLKHRFKRVIVPMEGAKNFLLEWKNNNFQDFSKPYRVKVGDAVVDVGYFIFLIETTLFRAFDEKKGKCLLQYQRVRELLQSSREVVKK